MDNASRLQYLDVLGIDVWVPRSKAENDRVLSADNLGKKGVNADSGIILPAPEAPMMAADSPWVISKVMSLNASTRLWFIP